MRRTRIVATIGPASADEPMLRSLLAAGVDVCRLNYSHGTPESKSALIARIRALEDEVGRPIAILADLPGPKLRLGTFDGVVKLENGSEWTLRCGMNRLDAAQIAQGELPVDHAGLSAELRVGDPVLVADGLVRLEVLSVSGKAGGEVRVVVVDGGHVSARKGVNVPGTVVNLPAVGPRDEAALRQALADGVDWVAVSYVRSVEDLSPARHIIEDAGMHVPLVAKIEHPAALEDLEEILDASNAVMVARGDLGVEIPMERVPIAQQRIIDAGLARGIPVIVATQMLESMTFNPRPTRAEVSDVSTAIRHGATAVMLSGETASGEHPLAAVEAMAAIAAATEEEMEINDAVPGRIAAFRATRALAHAGVELARRSGADAILVATEHGNAPRFVTGYRPRQPVFAVTDRVRAARRIRLLPGVTSIISPELERGSATMVAAIGALIEAGRIGPGQKVVAISGSPLAMRGATSTVRLYRIDENGAIEGAQ